MKRFSILYATAFALLAGCASQAAPLPQPDAPTSSGSSETAVTDQVTGQDQKEEVQEMADRLYVADAAVYRGVMQDLAVDPQGRTAWVLQRVDGAPYDYPELQVIITDSTRFGFDGQVGNGAYLEVYYGGKPDASNAVEAIAVNQLPSPDMTVYNGILTEIWQDEEHEGCGSLFLESLAQDGLDYTFHYSPETKFYLDFKGLKAGDRLHVVHSAASTRSLPPQSAALEVSYYTEPSEKSD